MRIKLIVLTIHDTFPVNFDQVAFPSPARRETAKGPFYSAPCRSYLAPEQRAYAEWSAAGLRERGWTVTLEEQEDAPTK